MDGLEESAVLWRIGMGMEMERGMGLQIDQNRMWHGASGICIAGSLIDEYSASSVDLSKA